MAESTLGQKLSFLSSNPYETPSTDVATVSPALTFEPIKSPTSEESAYRKKKNKKDKFAKMMEDSETYLDTHSSGIIEEFDTYIDKTFINDEDSDLKNNLISLGRRYARDNKSNAETSEIAKTYSASEKALATLYDEISQDKMQLQKDIESMRNLRTNKNYKALSELITSKTQFHNAALSVIKEMNSIKKNQFDMQMKNTKKAEDSANMEGQTNNAIKSLFGMGRGNLLGPIGGYEGASGAHHDSDEDEDDTISTLRTGEGIYNPDDDDEALQKKYYDADNEQDGDKFIKYEGRGVEYVLLVDSDDYKQVVAEDSEGNIISDYPLPSNIEDLDFEIDPKSNTASDNLHRNYKVRYQDD